MLSVLLALLAALGVVLVLFMVTRVVRAVRSSHEFDLPRRSRWRASKASPRVIPVSELPNRVSEYGTVKPPPAAEARAPAPRAAPVQRTPKRPSMPVPTPAVAPPAVPAQVLEPAVPQGRSEDVKQFRESKVEKNQRRGAEAAGESAAAAGGADYAKLGEQVTAVLTTAEVAAAEIRESAHNDAAKIRLDADENVKAARAEAETLRADANKYRDETRTTADAYAEQTRRAVDEEAAKARSALEEEARAVRADAERRAREIEAEALRRRDALQESTANLEQRIAGMAAAFRGMTVDLEDLLPRSQHGAEAQQEPEPAADVSLDDDSIEDALKPERAAAQSR